MKLPRLAPLLALSFALAGFTPIRAQEPKVTLEEPSQPDLIAELKAAPDGVLRVRTNQDGSFKSLVVKATVEIESVLGAAKGKQLAQKEAEVQCKRKLAQWLNENCVFAEGSNKTVTIETKGDQSKDAAGNTVNIRTQSGHELKQISESHASYSEAALRGLTVVSSDVLKGGEEYILVMALTQKGLNQSSSVADALAPRPFTSNGAALPGRGPASSPDRPAAESRVNKDALDDLK